MDENTKRAVGDPLVVSQAPPALRSQFLVENLTTADLPDIPGLERHTTSAAQVLSIFADGGGWWTEFYRRYPGARGFIRFSKLAFTPAHDQAVVYVSHSCGGLCGTGWLVWLRRSSTRWAIAAQSMLWIS
jgi:hypothetical protein